MKKLELQIILLVKNLYCIFLQNRKKNIFSLIVCSILIFFIKIDAKTVRAKVLDYNKNPIENAVIIVGGNIAFSDFKGLFTIKYYSLDDSLIAQKIGYEKYQTKISNLSNKILMKKKVVQLPEYKVFKKKEFISDNSFKLEIKSEDNIKDLMKNISVMKMDNLRLSGENNMVSILGNKAKHTLIMVDDIPINKNGEAYDVSSIPLENMESVEIIQGNASAIGGNSALGGIIKFKTKKNNDKMNFSSNNSFGSFSLFKSYNSISYNYKNFNITTNYKFLYAKNDYKYKDIYTEDQVVEKRKNNKKKISDLYNNVFLVTEVGLFNINFNYKNSYKQLPGPTTKKNNFLKAYLDADYYKFYSSWEKGIYENFIVKTVINYYFDSAMYDNRKSTFLISKIANRTKYHKLNSVFKLKYSKDNLTLENNLFYNIDRYKYCRIDLDDNDIEKSRIDITQHNLASNVIINYSLFDEKINNKLFLRYDFIQKNDEDSSEDNIFSTRWEQFYNIRNFCHFSYYFANAYNLPSFYDLYWKGDEQASGNEDLKSEKSIGYGVNLDLFYYNFVNVNFAFHRNKVTDMIYWLKGVNGWKPHNLAKAEITNLVYGTDFNLFNDFNFSFQTTRTFSVNKTKRSTMYNRPNVYTPSSITKIAASYLIFNFETTINYQRKGEQYTNLYNGNKKIKTQELINFNLKYLWNINITSVSFYSDFNNLLDKKYELYSDNPAPGFNWELGVRININKKEK